jgi:hypothetical protein
VKYAEPQQIEAGAAVHLSLDELESVDLPFNLVLTPGRLQRCFDGPADLLPSDWRNRPGQSSLPQ